jgi:TonB-linked SusC/RagA family outer membrane protein
MKKLLTFILIIFSFSAFAQERTLTGKVTDDTGQPLPGVTVIIKGTTQGAVTDYDGNYSIPGVSSESVLVFSFVGMLKQEIEVGSQTTISVTMAADTIGLEEVVAIGYGTQKKATVTGAISTVKGEELVKNRSSNFAASLAGRLPGLTVNMRSGDPGKESVQILIRGKSTLGNNQVLTVIDGVAGGNIQELNPEDIESISILKDASAAIYGARAANGVILVTTKRGKVGGPQISYSGNFGATQPTKLKNLMDSWEYAVAENEFLINQGQSVKWSDQDIALFKNGTDPLFHPNIDWYDVSFRDWTPQQQHNITLSGGTEKIKYFISGRIVDQERMFINGGDKGLNRYQLRSNIDAQVTKILKVGVDMNYSKDMVEDAFNGNYRPLWNITRMMPNAVAFWPNGLPGPTQFGYNPATQADSEVYGYNRENTFGFNTKLSFDLDLSQITSGLSLSGFGQFGDGSQNYEKFFKQSYFYNYDAVKDEYIKLPVGQTDQSPTLEETNNRSQSKTYNIKLAYQKQIGEHSIDAFVAYEQFQSNYAGFTAFRKNYLTDQLPTLSAGGDVGKDNSGYKSDAARINYFGRVNYGYKGKYLVSATLRYDGSQNFPTDNRFGLFPGVSAGWVLSQESFIKDNYAFVDVLKLKGSWGQMGNDAVPAYQYLATYNYGNGYYFGIPSVKYSGFIESTTPNPGITWEVAETTNLGFESVLWKGLLSVNLDLFQSKRKNILTKKNASTPDYSGLVLPDQNIGEVQSSGFELEIGHSKVINPDLSYFVNANMSYAKNKVNFFDESPNVLDFQKKTGYPIDAYLLYQADGIYQTQAEIDATPHLPNTKPGDIKYLDVNGDKKIDGKDMVRENLSPTPQIMYGINLGTKYKNWELSILVQGQALARTRLIPEGLYMDKEFFDGRWLKEGDNLYPRSFNSNRNAVGNNALNSTFWMKSAAFMRLKNVELAYTLPNSLTDKVNISNVRFYVNASNLFMIYDHVKIVDPETMQNGTTDIYPIQRLVNVGVRINF